ncbi:MULTISPECIES: hypothetical protein [Xanthomonas]|uniref:Transmembrane protein n=1 Tax=Xanthomonas dyei TaxID=743699 RepID=A0ABZ0D7C2_9XANT|nr:hypothetical protein [Xanthomonas dyei]WOB26099.1 hypothetical protein NYR99_20955 [Xanthomonas dyei]WOB53723.1 hypothetical protein NYR95_20960 [Xanthomonas dyei]
MLKTLFVLLTGFWPSILATLLVMANAPKDGHSDYWIGAPWLVLFSFPFSFFSLIFSVATVTKYAFGKGDKDERIKAASMWFWCSNGVLLLVGIAFMNGAFS